LAAGWGNPHPAAFAILISAAVDEKASYFGALSLAVGKERKKL